MNWINYNIFALISALLWSIGTGLLIFKNSSSFRKAGYIGIMLGISCFATFIALLWFNLGRPPMRTLGETRLWYSLFLVTTGYIIFLRWRYLVLLAFTIFMGILFLFINYLHPEMYTKDLMPALQSPWFAPHVIVYILAYAILGLSSLVAFFTIFQKYFRKIEIKEINLADNLVYMGFAFLTMGLIFGALWAKEAWGNYWTWDPKETWALLTWLSYLFYIHNRRYQPQQITKHVWILSFVFIILLICWFGINYLPSARNSIHVYSQQ